MLTLSRKVGESIELKLTKDLPAGTVIMLTLVEVRGEKSRIGIEADRSVNIRRMELPERVD